MGYDYRGKTALVTGASGGIGEEFARRLAARGMNLVLVARSADKLQALARQLASEHRVDVKVMPADLAVAGAAQKLLEACRAQQVTVDLLVNNAGSGTYGRFEDIPAERDNHLIQLNIAAVSDMAHAFILPMLKRGAGAVINVASSAGFQPTPHFAVYGATKAFVLSLSESLWALYRDRGVRVMALCPGPVATGFFEATQSNIADVKFFQRTMTAAQVVSGGLRAFERGSCTYIPGWMNWLSAFSTRTSPRWVTALVSERLMRPS
ncbi:MAG TPA: SDR family oxidoreductase [Opitutaceae bacterium]|nr:SDR family oxidoreductase [Opitutaceae bacterium]